MAQSASTIITKLSDRVADITPSSTLAITAKANKLKAAGTSIISFSAGEPDFDTPNFIKEATIKAINDNKTRYTPSSGILDLKRAIVTKFESENGLVYNHDQIIVSNGAKHSLFNALMAIVDKGDEVLIPSPYWLTYPELVKLAGGKPVYMKTTESCDFKINPEMLTRAINKRTRAIIFNSPSNPTGTVYTTDELNELAKVIEEAGIYVISDEIYEKLVFENAKHVSIASCSRAIQNKSIVVNGVSKSFAMTGFRIGYMAAPQEIADAVDALQSHTTSNPNTMAQYAALAALINPLAKDFFAEMNAKFNTRRELMLSIVKNNPLLSCNVPLGAFYLFVNISKVLGKSYKGFKINNSIDFADKLLDAGVAVIPGEPFGANDYIRLSYAVSPKDIEVGLTKLNDFIAELK